MEAKAAAFDMEADNFGATELRLGLPGTVVDEPGRKATPARGSKRPLAEAGGGGCRSGSSCCTGGDCDSMEGTSPPAKEQVVGWPPIRSYRKNCALQSRWNAKEGEVPGLYVKVGMDGAPYLRKIDLNMVGGYEELRAGLEAMFECFSIGFSAGEGRPAASDYAITYEDKDGDWMLAGDVPWEMFTSSCRRLRIMKESEARGFGSISLSTNS